MTWRPQPGTWLPATCPWPGSALGVEPEVKNSLCGGWTHQMHTGLTLRSSLHQGATALPVCASSSASFPASWYADATHQTVHAGRKEMRKVKTSPCAQCSHSSAHLGHVRQGVTIEVHQHGGLVELQATRESAPVKKVPQHGWAVQWPKTRDREGLSGIRASRQARPTQGLTKVKFNSAALLPLPPAAALKK